jgi:hypothetical protein
LCDVAQKPSDQIIASALGSCEVRPSVSRDWAGFEPDLVELGHALVIHPQSHNRLCGLGVELQG